MTDQQKSESEVLLDVVQRVDGLYRSRNLFDDFPSEAARAIYNSLGDRLAELAGKSDELKREPVTEVAVAAAEAAGIDFSW